ncbi:MAG: dihydroorotate dehydrogenase [bacterium]|nr:dihydroorotate dehydrogenase [bacterium]
MRQLSLDINIAGIKMKNPIITASGTFGYGLEYSQLIDIKKFGAIVTKTITLEPRIGNPQPRIVEVVGGMLNSIGLQNPGAKVFIEEKLPKLKEYGVPIIANISGSKEAEFVKLADLFKDIGLSGLELNISCPNVEHAGLFAQDADTTYKLVRKVRKVTSLPLIVKLTPNVTDITLIARAAEDGGADAISLINTLIGMSIDIQTKRPKLANVIGGLSGPAVKPVALRMVYEVSKKVRIPVIGMGGIMTSDDAIEFLLTGASAVAIGTANFVNPNTCCEIIEGIKTYMRDNKFNRMLDIIGQLR